MTPVWAALLIVLAALPRAGVAQVLFQDNFNDATLAPWTTTDATRSGILTGGLPTAASGAAAYTRHQAVTVTSPTFNAAVPAARLTIWIRRGSDAFAPNSEDTDGGEDFLIEYQRADSSWGLLASYLGSGTNGQIYTDSYVLPADALHGTLALRARQTNGSGPGFDYWHFDDVVITQIAIPPPLAVGSCDDFEFGLTNWTVNPTSGLGGISGATSSSPSNSLFLNGGVVNIASNVIDTTDPFFSDLTMWIRRGSDAFSEDPDVGENLVVEYFNDIGVWTVLETFSGSGMQGQIFTRSYTLPAAGRHANLQLRYRMTAGSGTIWDFWHIDDVCFEQLNIPSLLVSKVAQTVTDPINLGVNPKAIPGAEIEYTIGVTNQGPGPVDNDSLVITDPLPPDTALFVGPLPTPLLGPFPIDFVDGTVPSGLDLPFSYATDVTFSNQPGGGPPFTYSPVDPDLDGFDPAVTGIRINPSGVMNGASAPDFPTFDIVFRVRVE